MPLHLASARKIADQSLYDGNGQYAHAAMAGHKHQVETLTSLGCARLYHSHHRAAVDYSSGLVVAEGAARN